MTDHAYAPRQMTDHVWVVTTTDPEPSHGLTSTISDAEGTPLTFRTHQAAQDKADEINCLLNTIKQGEAKLDHGRKLVTTLTQHLSDQETRALLTILTRTVDPQTLLNAFNELKPAKDTQP
jgi:hypothetical protein